MMALGFFLAALGVIGFLLTFGVWAFLPHWMSMSASILAARILIWPLGIGVILMLTDDNKRD